MFTTNHNAANGAPYLRHARERERLPHDGWTMTVKIAIPRPRQWLVCSTGWIVICLLYLAGTLWIGGGFDRDWSLSNNFSSWNGFLPQHVSTFLPVRAVHDTDDMYEESLVEPKDSEMSVSGAATNSTESKVAPSSNSTLSPIASESKEEKEISEVTLSGSNSTNTGGDMTDSIPEEHMKHEESSKFYPQMSESGQPDTSPSNETANRSEVPLEEVETEEDEGKTSWSKASRHSKEFRDATGDESHLHTRRHEFTTTEIAAPEPALESLPTSESTDPESRSLRSPNSGSATHTDTYTQNSLSAKPDSIEAGMDVVPSASGPTVSHAEVEPVIRATNVRGRKAVETFRNHLNCFSESGKWIYDPTPRNLPWNYIGELQLSNCDSFHQGIWGYEADTIARDGSKEWSVRETLKWVWQTNETCPLHQVDRNELCRRLGPRRNVMVVGDTLNHALSWSIMNHLITNSTGYERFPSYDRISDGMYEMCGDIFGAGNGFKISFVRNDRLSLLSEAAVDYRTNFLEYPWLDLVEKYDVKMLILNRGAHYENDAVLEKALRETFTAVKSRYPDVQVVYRNTPPGHANCTNITAAAPLEERQQFGWDGVKWPDVYSWGEFARQNVLAKKIVEEFEYIYLDVDTMLALRIDGHLEERDCLHYCLPGPFDVTVQLLYNILPFL